MNSRGWTQVVSGLDIIVWSRLASWDESRLELKAATDEPEFDKQWKTLNQRSGRWLCWIAFCVGAENFVKGAFGLYDYHVQNFGACHPWKRMKIPVGEILLVSDAICRLATEVSLASDFVPALNRILRCLDQTALAAKYPGHDPAAF
jgi:hypothetical protein